jgi:plasmid stabilization system protein ParE
MRVRFTLPAQADLQRIHDFIAKDDPVVASRVVVRLIEHARALGAIPYEGRETEEPGARVIVVPRLRYFIFYLVAQDEVHITHIRHTSRRRPAGWER